MRIAPIDRDENLIACVDMRVATTANNTGRAILVAEIDIGCIKQTIPKIPKELNTLLPNKLPIATAPCLVRRATIEVTSSGVLVPSATIIELKKNRLTPRRLAKAPALSVNVYPATTSIAKPMTRLRMVPFLRTLCSTFNLSPIINQRNQKANNISKITPSSFDSTPSIARRRTTSGAALEIVISLIRILFSESFRGERIKKIPRIRAIFTTLLPSTSPSETSGVS